MGLNLPPKMQFPINLFANLKALLLFIFFYSANSFSQTKSLDSLRKLVNAQKEDTQKVKMLNALGDSLISYNDLENALLIAKEANSLSEKLQYITGMGDSHFRMGIAYKTLYKNEAALQQFLIALKIAEATNNKKKIVDIYIKIAWIHAKADYVKAIEDFTKVLNLSTEIHDTLSIATAYWGFAENYSALGNYSEAIINAFKALRLFESLNNDMLQMRVYNCLGYIYDRQNNYIDAFSAYSSSLSFAEKCHNKFLIATANTSLGDLLFSKQKYEEAIKKYTDAFSSYKELGEKYGIADIYEKIGAIIEMQGDVKTQSGEFTSAVELYKKSEKNYKAALDMNVETDFKIAIAASYIHITGINIKLKNFSTAKDYLEKSLKLSLMLGSKNEIRGAYLKASDFHLAQKDYKKAFENYKTYIDYRDSLVNEENTRKTVQTQMQYEFDKKETATKAEQDKKDVIANQNAIRQRNIRNSTFAGLGGVLVFALVVYRQRNKIAKEKKRSEDLLLNILPAETAEELKNTGAAKAKSFDSVTVLFTDFKNFTQASELLSAEELVKEINNCYSEFDRIITEHGIEKIKTIGDAYMCAGGLPVVNATHPIDVVKAGLEMQQFILKNKSNRQLNNKPFFELRVGIHTGTVVAGIVGTKKFAYDIWGDTVNTASRMESSGVTGKVNISGTTYELIKDKFECSYRGKVVAKNKGQIDMYFVEKCLT